MKKIKNKTELLNAKLREFKIKEQALKDCVPLELHNKVKKQLQDLLKRHKDFRSMLVFNQPNNAQHHHQSAPQQQQQIPVVSTNQMFNDSKSSLLLTTHEFTKDMFPVNICFYDIILCLFIHFFFTHKDKN
jgi:hypothetical protein